MFIKSLLSKRLSDIICDSVNLIIKSITRSQIQVVIDDWKNRLSLSIATIDERQKSRLDSSLSTTLNDHKEIVALEYNNMIDASNTLLFSSCTFL